MTAKRHHRKSRATKTKQIAIFAQRSFELADKVEMGETAFLDAVDTAYSAAKSSGVLENVGDDAVQIALATAFRGVRR
jgi:hypothetical protein